MQHPRQVVSPIIQIIATQHIIARATQQHVVSSIAEDHIRVRFAIHNVVTTPGGYPVVSSSPIDQVITTGGKVGGGVEPFCYVGGDVILCRYAALQFPVGLGCDGRYITIDVVIPPLRRGCLCLRRP